MAKAQTINGRVVGKAEFLAAARGHVAPEAFARLEAFDESLLLPARVYE